MQSGKRILKVLNSYFIDTIHEIVLLNHFFFRHFKFKPEVGRKLYIYILNLQVVKRKIKIIIWLDLRVVFYFTGESYSQYVTTLICGGHRHSDGWDLMVLIYRKISCSTCLNGHVTLMVEAHQSVSSQC